MHTLKNKNYKKKICFDIDGVICNNTWGDYENAMPYPEAIKKINDLYDDNNYIMLFTSRYFTKLNGDREKIYNQYYLKTSNQLSNWGLKFHELILCKPEYDIFIDDKNFNYSRDWLKFDFK